MKSWHRSACLLVILTVTAFGLGHTTAVAAITAGMATLAIAYYKGRLVILDFMELREAPALWRLLAEGWLVTVTLALLSVYIYSG